MIRLSENSTVRLAGLKPEMDKALYAVSKVFDKYHLDTTITAGTEEFDYKGSLIHMVGSLHPRGYALDLRSREVPNAVWTKFVSDIRESLTKLGKPYQLFEHKTHLHIEYDLKVAWGVQNAKNSV